MNRYFIHLMLLVSVFSLTVSSAGVVCLGDDGHVAIEPDRHSHCDHDQRAEDTAPRIACHHCSPCTDIDLSQIHMNGVKIQKSVPADTAPVAAVTTRAPHPARPERPCSPGESRYFSPLRAIVLLT